MKTLSLVLTLLLFSLPCFAQSAAQTAPPTNAPYLDPSLPLDQRVNDLVSRMTLEEKVSQMQDVAPAIPRLDIPAYNWWNEGLHGVARAGVATVFPQAIALAATWDSDLLHRVADVISTEARAKYNDAIAHHNTGRYAGLTFWSPNINIFRDPRWGRGQETYGEDPFLTARMGVAFVTGLQGDDPHYLKTVSTPKHYAVHSGPETLRHHFDVPVSLHDLYDTYTPAFRATIVESHADSVMCAYNSIRGEPACANHLLFDLLRNKWGFRGYVVSDCWAVSDLHQGHGFVLSLDQAAALSVKAGTDLSCGPEFSVLNYSVRDRLLDPADIDRAVKRLFEARFRLGMFDPPDRVPWSKLSLSDVDTPANRKLALDTARESIVLLKNSSSGFTPLPHRSQRSKPGAPILPLDPNIKSIAVVGPTADSLSVLLGNYNGTPSTYVTILDGIRKRFPKATINAAIGAPLTETRPVPIPGAFFHTSGDAGILPAQSLAQAKSGLLGEYFSTPTLSGTPAVSRIEPDVNFEFNNVAPAPGLPSGNYSIRWTGQLAPPIDGDYRLGVGCDGGCRLYLDNKLIVDDWSSIPHNDRATSTVLHLQAGHSYPVQLEYYHHEWESSVHLLWLPPNLLEDAVAAARKSDVTIAVVGTTAQLEGEESSASDPGFFGGDRTDITLPAPQEQLLEAVAATGKPLIVVLTSGSAVALNWANEHASAILAAWYPGEEGGTAVADVLSGDYNPAGRLPITFYKSAAQLPPFTNYSMFGRTYRYMTEAPLYPFGFGLSYSTFRYSDPKIENAMGSTPATVEATAPNSSPNQFQEKTYAARTVSTVVTNSSSIPADEVVELYISHPGIDGAPLRALVGFRRVHLEPHASQEVRFLLTPRELSIVDPQGNRIVLAGPVTLWIGSSQPITIPGQPPVPGVALIMDIKSTTPLPE